MKRATVKQASKQRCLALQQKKKKKGVSGVVIGAVLCCLPGATLGSFYDDWRASKEAPKMAAALREREANRPPPGSAPVLPEWGPETCASSKPYGVSPVCPDGTTRVLLTHYHAFFICVLYHMGPLSLTKLLE